MKIFIRSLFAITFLSVLGACTVDPNATYTRTIEITSNPEGASLIVNGIAMSKTPISVEVEATDNDCFLIPTQFIALKMGEDTHTQIVSYPAYKVGNENVSKIPEKIEFDMTRSSKQD